MQNIPWTETVFILTSILTLLAYHIYLVYMVRTRPLKTSIGLSNRLRRGWVETVIEEKRDVLAVQTLRNWVMAASFLASTAILLAIGILNVAFRSEKLSPIAQVVNLLGSQSETLWFVKLLLLTIDFFFAFFNFSLAIRYYNHAGFMINVPGDRDSLVSPEYIAKVLHRGTLHYTIGMRGYYLAIPFALWLFGPTWLLIGTIILVAVLRKLDQAPSA
ncbi:MAG: DUF599 domain-containing protein [Deltaproteobacteria bacterium]|nr:MAG: DUF599 domain-containing protein [Deltaproteobacteria bacterium]